MTLRRTALRAAAFATAIATAFASGALAAPAAGAQGSSNDPAPAFYQPPAELPAAPGELIKTEPFPLAAAIPPIPGAGSARWSCSPIVSITSSAHTHSKPVYANYGYSLHTHPPTTVGRRNRTADGG